MMREARTGMAWRMGLAVLMLTWLGVGASWGASYDAAEEAKLKAMQTANDPDNNLNWNTESNPSSWNSVTWQLDAASVNHALTLTLQNKSLQGNADLSNLSKLFDLNISGNQALTGLNINGNTALQRLSAYNTGLESLDVSGNSTLEILYVQDNASLKTLTTGSIANLKTLYAYNTGLESLDVSGNSALKDFNIYNNTSLKTLITGNIAKLEGLYASDNVNLESLDVSGNSGLKNLYLSNNTSLKTLITGNIANLEVLNAYYTGLESLDVSGNSALTTLYLNNSFNLKTLTLGNHANLQDLYVGGTPLESLDLSGSPALSMVSAPNARFSTITIASGSAPNQIDVGGNRLPLSQLYPLMQSNAVHFGTQWNVVIGNTAALRPGVGYDLSSEYRFDDKNTRFAIARSDGTTAVEGTDYTVSDGVVTFLVPGTYTIAMENDAIYSKGTVKVVDPETYNFVDVDFDAAGNPLAQVNTAPLTVLDNDQPGPDPDPEPAKGVLQVKVDRAGGSINVSRLARALDLALDSVPLEGALGDMVILANGATDSQALEHLNQLHGETLAGGIDAVVTQAGRMASSYGFNRAMAFAPEGFEPAVEGWTANASLTGADYPWTADARGLGGFGSVDAYDGYLGYDVKTFGAMLSLDRSWGDCLRTGALLGYSRVKADWDDYGSETKSDNFHTGLFAGYRYGNWTFAAQGQFGYGDVENTRGIPSANLKVKADYDLYWGGAGLAAEYRWEVGNGFALTPKAGLDYLYSRSDSFREKGANNLNLRANSQHTDSVEAVLALRAEKAFCVGGTLLTPYVSAGAAGELADRQTSVRTRFAEVPVVSSFNAESSKLDRWRFVGGAGMSAQMTERLRLAVDYELQLQRHRDFHAFQAELSWAF